MLMLVFIPNKDGIRRLSMFVFLIYALAYA